MNPLHSSPISPSRLRLIAGMALALWVVVGAGLLRADDLPPSPADAVRDDTRALSADAHQEMVKLAAALKEKIHAEVWFSSDTFIPTSQNLRSYARELRVHWSGDKEALLMAYDRATDSHLLSFSPTLWERYPTAEIIDLMQLNAQLMADKTKSAEARLMAVTRQTSQTLGRLEKERHLSARTLPYLHLHLGKFFAAGLAGGAVLLFLFGTASRRRDFQAAWRSFFPSVQVGIRFGAPHGGGIMVETAGRKEPV